MSRTILALAAITVAATLALAITSRPPGPVPASRPEPARSAVGGSGAADEFVVAPWTPANRPRTEWPEPEAVPAPGRDEAAPAVAEPVAVATRFRAPRRAAPAGVTPPPPRTSGTEEEFLADAAFRQLDTNGDGVLSGAELPDALRREVNERGAIDAATFAKLFQAAVRRSLAAQAAAAAPAQPPGAPGWFRTLDTDGDGQVSLYEWRAAGRSVTEFQLMDANGDGLLTAREAQAFAAQQGAPAPTSGTTPAGPSLTGAAAPAPAALPAPEGTNPASRANALFGHYVGVASGALIPARAQAASAPAPAKTGPAPLAPAPAKPALAKPAPAPVKPAVAAKPAPVAPAREVATLPLPFTGVPYWELRNKQNVAPLLAGKHPSVLFLGDSITDYLQNGPGNPLWNAYYAPLPALDFAIGGIRTSHVLWQVETGQVLAARPKVVVLLIGSNNLGIANQEPEEVALGIEKIVDEIGAQLPQTRILLLGLLPRGFAADDAFRPRIARVNSLIAGLHDGARVRYLDIGKTFLSADGSISPDVMPDGCHPSLAGYMLYTAAVWPTLADMLKP